MNTDTTRGVGGLAASEVSGRVIGAFYNVYDELRAGFLELVYANAMAIALRHGGVPFEREPPVPVFFRNEPVGIFRPDFVVAGKLIVELKAASAIDEIHQAQLLNYLRASGIEVGLILNFGPTAAFKRMILSPTSSHPCKSV